MAQDLNAAVTDSTYTDISAYISVIFNIYAQPKARIEAIDNMGKVLAGSAHITATEQLLALIDSEPNASIVGHAMAAVVKINGNGLGIINQNGQNPVVKAFTKVANSNKPHEIRQLAIQFLGKSASVEAIEPLAGLLETLRDPSLIKAAIDAAYELSANIKNNAISDALVSGLAKIANSHRSYENRQQAINAIGKISSVEAAEVLAELLQTVRDPSLILVVVDAAAESFARNPDNSIIDEMAGIFIEKLDFGPDALAANPDIIKAQNKILNTLASRKDYTIRLLNRLLKDELSRSFKEQNPDKVDNIRYLMSLVRSRNTRQVLPTNVNAIEVRDPVPVTILPVNIPQERSPEENSYLKAAPTVPVTVTVLPQTIATQEQPPKGAEATLAQENDNENLQPSGGLIIPDSELTVVLPPEKVMQRQLPKQIVSSKPSVVKHPGAPSAKTVVVKSDLAPSVSNRTNMQAIEVAPDNDYTVIAGTTQVNPVSPTIRTMPQAVQEEMQSWISKAPSSQARVQALLRLGNSGDNLYINPFVFRAIREDLKSPDENVRIAASYVYSKIDSRNIYHVPNTNIDIELLGQGLNSAEINFQERLFKIIALGKTADPLAARILLQAYYKIPEIYPVIEGQDSEKEHERLLLAKAVGWSLGNMQEAGVDELRITLNTRFNQGKLGYNDAIPMSILERLSPEEFNKLLLRIHLKPVTQSAGSLVAKYTQSGPFYQLNNNIERRALAFQWDSYSQTFSDKDWQGLGLPSDFEKIAAALVSHTHTDHRIPVAAAVRLGQMNDVRAVWALTAGLQDDDEFVVAASVWGLSQFESPTNEQDLRIPFLKEVLDKHTHPFIRANVALALGTSGDPKAVELLDKLLSKEENSLVKLFAINSAQTLALKFKNSTLIRGLLTLAREDYNYDPLTLLGLGENFGPVGQAAFDAINAIGEKPELRPILVKTLRDALAEELKQETRNIQLINDVYSDLLKRFGPEDYAKLSDVMIMVKNQYWLPIVGAVLGGILAFGGIFMLLYFKVFRGKPELLAEIDTDHISSGSGGKPPEKASSGGGPDNIGLVAAGKQIDRQASLSAKHEPLIPNSNVTPKLKAATKEWEILLLHDRLSEAEISQILQLNYILINLVPFTLTQNGNDLESRASQVDMIINLLQNTINKLINAIKAGDYPENNKISIYIQECIEICRYFSDYRLSLGYLEDLHLSANYKPAKEKKARWRKVWGIEYIAIAAKENLAYLLEKIHTRGNQIVPYFYQVPKDRQEYRSLVKDYYEKIKPSKLGIAPKWQIRKEMTRLMPLYFGVGFGIFTAITGLTTLTEGFSMGHILWYLFRVLSGSFMGFGISTYFSWQFIKKGWEEESKTFKELHAKLDEYEEALHKYSSLEQAADNRQQMLNEEINEVIAALSQELNPSQEESVDAVLVMSGPDSSRSDLLRNSLQGLVNPDIPVFIVPDDTDSRGKILYGSSDSFAKAYSYFDPSLSFGNFIDALSRDRDAVCLTRGGVNILPGQRKKSMKNTRIIVINATSPRLDWLTTPLSNNKLRYHGRSLNAFQVALANGYRITQMLKKQNRSGVAHFNGDGVYLGPVREFKDDLTILASWSSQEQMVRQGLGLLMPDSEFHALKYYDKFKIGRINNWLEREMVGGRYDLRNTKKRQMVISTGILVASFDNETRFNQYLGMLNKIREYLISHGTPGNIPVKVFPDIIIPLIMLSQGENIYTYLEAHLKNLTEEYEFAATYKDELRKFYLEMYKIIEEDFPTDRPFMFPVQIPYPHESVYSRGSAADLSVMLGQYGFTAASLPLARGSEPPETSSSPVAGKEQGVLASVQDEPPVGGIDLRSLNAINRKDYNGVPFPVRVGNGASDEEWQEINRLIKARISPSVNRIADYLKSDTQELAAGERVKNVRAGIADILRMEEESAVTMDNDLKELLELVESNATVCGLRSALVKIVDKHK